MKKLHPIQKKLIDLLKENQSTPLTVRELQYQLGVSSPSLIHHHIQQLEKKGYLRRNPSNPKDYHVLKDSPERGFSYLNLYGLACCGISGTILDGDPVEKIPISTKVLGVRADKAFLIKAKGQSMLPKISNGDLVVAEFSNTANQGDVIICVNDGEAFIKKFSKSGNTVILSSLNKSEEFPPFPANPDNFRIEGIVKSVISYQI